VATTAASTAVVATAAAIVEAALLRVRRQVGHVMVLADLARVRGRVLTLHDPDEANVVDAILDRVERLEQAREPLFLDPELLFDLGARGRIGRLDRRIDLGLGRSRGSRLRTLGAARALLGARTFSIAGALGAARAFTRLTL